MHTAVKATNVWRRDKTTAYKSAMAKIVGVSAMRISIAAKHINIRHWHIRLDSHISGTWIPRVNITCASK